MTLSSSDIKLSFNSSLDKPIIRSLFSNAVVSSAALVLLLLFIFSINDPFPSFIYGYATTLVFSLISANYIRKDYDTIKGSMSSDFKSLMTSAGSGPIIIKGENERKSEQRDQNDQNEIAELDYILQ